ncbi:MAG: ABC transporter substrate-binding protein [Alphaproteobacteria bacterium]|nr:ABC transporter substrate-binding protein [Alphaproteobacteria bacterium]
MPLMALTRVALTTAAVIAGGSLAATSQAQAQVTKSHGIAMHGDLKYPADFRHFEYANPDAPKGGEVRFAAPGSFDSFNPYVLKGVPIGVPGTIETLMVNSGDEPFSEYCLLCETIEVPADRSWIVFNLRPQARFQDGSPVTVDDVIWTFETLKTKGHPRYRAYYASVLKAEKLGERAVKFSFADGTNRELPLITGQLPVMSKAWWATRDFEKQTLEAPLGSGPYKLDSFEQGRFVVVKLLPDYWGKDLPVRRGVNNFGAMRYDWYRDVTVMQEAFKSGEYHVRLENQALAWATRYESPAKERGLYRLEELPTRMVSGMQGFAMNMRREPFKDARVREALAYAFDFEWSNRTLFHGAYTRTRSYFDNSELSARGLPGKDELEILEPLRGQIPERVFTEEYNPPKTDGSGNIRDNLRVATRLLREAGWQVKDGKLVDGQGRQMKFEVLLNSGSAFERIVLPYVESLKRLGIDASARSVDTAQYQRRSEEFDFDMTVDVFGQSESPGNEQRDQWTSQVADTQGSGNSTGLKSPAVDKLVELVIAAPDRASLVTRVRALDRVLQWSFLVVPNWHSRVARVASWDRFGRPAVLPRTGYDPSVWWVDTAKDEALREKRAQLR